MKKLNHEIDNKYFLDAISKLSVACSLDKEGIAEFLAESFKYVLTREYSECPTEVNIDIENCKIDIFKQLKIVSDEYYFGEGMEDSENFIPMSKVLKKTKGKKLEGEIYSEPIYLHKLDSKIVKNILLHFQKLTLEAMNQKIYNKWIKRKGEVFEGMVERVLETKEKLPKEAVVTLIDPENELETTKGVLHRMDFVQSLSNSGYRIYETLIPGKIYYFQVKDVVENSAGCPILLSRTSPEIVKYLMKRHISELHEGLVEIKAISRISGIKSKVLVSTKNNNIDPVGCCIGPKGSRLKVISSQLMNERIDVILWNSDPIKNIVNAFSNATILGYKILEEEENTILLISTLENLLLAIGRRGVNVKLVSLLTGWKIFIKTIQEAKSERIDYIPIDEGWDSKTSDISGRLYRLHKFKYSDRENSSEEQEAN
ncbi:NusA N-terminal domain-containing protein [Candidatus Mycoplasma haematominutum]|uniref:Transcription termination/antitermination protein NusA n=1 Tax=Candidatus Mycoplasma haematominutum 'Birmingham 1' TaxID=1116213 RepID=G8C2W6_9MOLU|nr:NusA N-terminal domain-containing protein [Candidatus Mycoplasma haematominutum]CCE66664.1 transcription termination protein NusA [Candidatus Mycoplasma haematominutum 'Birmingham 1']